MLQFDLESKLPTVKYAFGNRVKDYKKGLTRSSFLFSSLKVLGLFQNAGTGTFLWVAFILHRYKCDLNFVFDDHLYGFIAVRATRGE